ncbi:MAG: hypothetical protein EOO63_14845, partial [Hymenobacter sp.]
MREVAISQDGLFGYAGHTVYRLNAAVGGPSGKASGNQPAAEPTSPERKPAGGGLISPWGEDNLFPQAVVKDIERNTVLGSVLERKTATMYGQGITYGVITGRDKSGLPTFEPQFIPEIEDFLDGSNVA